MTPYINHDLHIYSFHHCMQDMKNKKNKKKITILRCGISLFSEPPCSDSFTNTGNLFIQSRQLIQCVCLSICLTDFVLSKILFYMDFAEASNLGAKMNASHVFNLAARIIGTHNFVLPMHYLIKWEICQVMMGCSYVE